MNDDKNNRINYKSKLMDFGNYTTTSIYLKTLLESNESILFDCIFHLNNVNEKYISISLLQLYTSLSNTSVIKTKSNLIKAGFVSIKGKTQKGSIFEILWENIYNIIKELNEENNPVQRLIICDKFRVSKGLNTINQKNIEIFLNSAFDVSFTKNTKKERDYDKEDINNKSNQEKPIFKKNNTNTINEDEMYKKKLFVNLNKMQTKINNCTIEDKNSGIYNMYMNELNQWKNNAVTKKIKITYNQNTKLWN